MWVCICFKINDKSLDRLVEEQGLEAVINRSKKLGCGTCVQTIVDLKNLKAQRGAKIGL